ncbi:MAG: CAP domain-containing protein [Dehalococcoidales bacterium]|nr:CAP domain-containing protein [Dehalococcoidales bacterium]
MTKITRIILLSVISGIILLNIIGCTPSVPQSQYDAAMNELNTAKSQMAELQGELNESAAQIAALQQKLNQTSAIDGQYKDLSAQYAALQKQQEARITEIQILKTQLTDLNTRFEQLQGQNTARNNELQALKSEYDGLNKQFQELQKQYDVVVQGTALLNEEEISQRIFDLINQERVDNGVPELQWGVNLYSWANQNSQEMAAQGKYVYSGAGAIWQDVFMAVRYGTVEQIANAVLTIWSVNDYSYKYNIINAQSIYGAVATYKSGDIYYITYISSIFR